MRKKRIQMSLSHGFYLQISHRIARRKLAKPNFASLRFQQLLSKSGVVIFARVITWGKVRDKLDGQHAETEFKLFGIGTGVLTISLITCVWICSGMLGHAHPKLRLKQQLLMSGDYNETSEDEIRV